MSMPKWLAACGPPLAALLARATEAIGRRWRALRGRLRPVPVEVLVVDRARRRAVHRSVRRGLRRLRRVLGAPLPAGVAIVVQELVTPADRQLAGCYQQGQRPDGSRFALMRLALQVDGHRLTTDELLAVLAEQYIGLAMDQGGGTSVLVPVELEPALPAQATDPVEVRRLQPRRPDPLAPRPHRANGAAAGWTPRER
jgi:hypothetical protein